MLSGGVIIGRGQSKCAIRPGFCGDEVTSLLHSGSSGLDASFDRETNPRLLERLEQIDPHMNMFVYAKKVNCARYADLTESEKQDVRDCLGNVPDHIDFFTTRAVDTTFAPHYVPKKYQERFIELMGILHEHGIAHGDLHGANLGLIGDNPVIFDFGNAVLTHDPVVFAEDEHVLERTFAPEAPRKRRRESPVKELEEALRRSPGGPKVSRMRLSKSPFRSPGRSPKRSPRRSPGPAPGRSPKKSPGRSPKRSPKGFLDLLNAGSRRLSNRSIRSMRLSNRRIRGGSKALLQKFYIKAIANAPVNYMDLKEYIAKVCNAVSTLDRPVSYWQKEWTFDNGAGRKRMLTMIKNFLTHGTERYDPLGLRGL